jgi:hypothetical protein
VQRSAAQRFRFSFSVVRVDVVAAFLRLCVFASLRRFVGSSSQVRRRFQKKIGALREFENGRPR